MLLGKLKTSLLRYREQNQIQTRVQEKLSCFTLKTVVVFFIFLTARCHIRGEPFCFYISAKKTNKLHPADKAV